MKKIGHLKFKFRRYDIISYQNSIMLDKLFNTSEVDEDNICMFLYYLLWSENVDNIFRFFIWFDRNSFQKSIGNTISAKSCFSVYYNVTYMAIYKLTDLRKYM